MGQAQINVRTLACSGTFIARTKQVALTHNVRGEELNVNHVPALQSLVKHLNLNNTIYTCKYVLNNKK